MFAYLKSRFLEKNETLSSITRFRTDSIAEQTTKLPRKAGEDVLIRS